MRRGTILIAILAAVAGLVAAIATRIMHDGMSARATPTKLEEFIARNTWRLSLPKNARTTPNPVSPSAEALREARLHFADHCSVCHGNDGGGDAPLGRGMYPKPPDLREPLTQNRSDGELFWIIENGVRFTGMPAFSSHGAQDESWKLVLFIRHLPQLTPEERLEMSRNNPKSPADREEDQQEDEFLNGAPSGKKPEPTHTHP